MTFEEIYNKRKKLVDVHRENEVDEAIKNLLTELYPDNAHFIYELLQNAEDANATKVEFILEKNQLQCHHNGLKLFNEEDVYSITSIANSSKKDDVNQIGKFGVGFKAVFSYTNSPQIHSGNFAFEINDLVVPTIIEQIQRAENETVFKFPFNNPEKPQEKAYREVKQGLEELKDITLLFLNNIQTITFTLNGTKNSIERIELDNNKVLIKKNDESSRWLRFKKFLPNSQKLYVSVAYALDEKEEIKPVDGKVSIFFPAEKETSNLKFHIHAPFASTVARDSIKDLEENKTLISLIADTVVESLSTVKELELMNHSFLETLPNKDDIIHNYKPIFEKVVEAFNQDYYTPTENNGYQPANLCYRANSAIRKIIDLGIFSDINTIKNPRQINNRTDKFYQSLNLKGSFSSEDLFHSLFKLEKASIQRTFSEKDSLWFREFFLAIEEIVENEGRYFEQHLKEFNKFIKLSDGKINITNKQCYFLTKQKEDYYFVDPDIYTENGEEIQNIKSLLERIGVKEIGLLEEAKEIFKENYFNNSFPNDESHLAHIRLFLKCYQEEGYSNIFKNKKFIKTLNNWSITENIIIDIPYKITGLSCLVTLKKFNQISELYYKKLNENELGLFIKFLKEFGAKDRLIIEEKNLDYRKKEKIKARFGRTRETDTGTNVDYDIQDLDIILNSINTDIACLIWNTLAKTPSPCYTAKYRPNQDKELYTEPSSFMQVLGKKKWLPDENGNLFKPKDILQESLPNDFIVDNHSLHSHISLGENLKRNEEEYKKTDAIIKDKTGYSLNIIENAKNAGVTEEDIKKLIEEKSKNKDLNLPEAIDSHKRDIKKKTSTELHQNIIKDINEYEKQVNKELEKIIQNSKKATQRSYSTKTKINKSSVRFFLNNQYKGHCQICGFTFLQKDGSNYFEILDWLSEKITKKSSDFMLDGSSLCLCANCHSIIKNGDFHPLFIENKQAIQEAISMGFDKFSTFISEQSVEHIPESFESIEMDIYKIPIQMNNKKTHIFYSEEHFLRFYTMLKIKQ